MFITLLFETRLGLILLAVRSQLPKMGLFRPNLYLGTYPWQSGSETRWEKALIWEVFVEFLSRSSLTTLLYAVTVFDDMVNFEIGGSGKCSDTGMLIILVKPECFR
jgi:hypothetical protein